MKQLTEFCLLAISDTQLIIGIAVGALLLWLAFRVLKSMAGMFFKFILILLLLAAAGGLVFFLLRPA